MNESNWKTISVQSPEELDPKKEYRVLENGTPRAVGYGEVSRTWWCSGATQLKELLDRGCPLQVRTEEPKGAHIVSTPGLSATPSEVSSEDSDKSGTCLLMGEQEGPAFGVDDLQQGDCWRQDFWGVRVLDEIHLGPTGKAARFIWREYGVDYKLVTIFRSQMERAMKASGFRLRRDGRDIEPDCGLMAGQGEVVTLHGYDFEAERAEVDAILRDAGVVVPSSSVPKESQEPKEVEA